VIKLTGIGWGGRPCRHSSHISPVCPSCVIPWPMWAQSSHVVQFDLRQLNTMRIIYLFVYLFIYFYLYNTIYNTHQQQVTQAGQQGHEVTLRPFDTTGCFVSYSNSMAISLGQHSQSWLPVFSVRGARLFFCWSVCMEQTA